MRLLTSRIFWTSISKHSSAILDSSGAMADNNSLDMDPSTFFDECDPLLEASQNHERGMYTLLGNSITMPSCKALLIRCCCICFFVFNFASVNILMLPTLRCKSQTQAVAHGTPSVE